jgi:predicted ATP-grasp superfamily ATP-dependent carboligase
MRRAIVDDFAAVPGVRVVSTIDSRLPFESRPGVDVRITPDREGLRFESLAADADYTALIAPETDGILAELTRTVERAGGRSLGSGPRAIDLCADKARLAHHFVGRDIPSPPTRTLRPGDRTSSADWDGPIVVKPRFGAGSVDTFVVRDRRHPTWAGRDRGGPMVAQPYLPGEPMSASLLVDVGGNATLLAVGRQRIEVDPEGRIWYRGGTITGGLVECPAAVEAAVASVIASSRFPGLRGFVGVDFLLDAQGRAVVLEINPRPTTSFVGLARMLPPGTIAGAWLAAIDGPLEGTDWPARLRPARTSPAVSFDADGTILAEGFPR